jgi:hypothetical protein
MATSNTPPAAPTHIQLAVDGDWVPSSCTLPTVEQPLRVAEFDEFFADAVQSVERQTPTTLNLTIALAAEAVARDLAEREVACCSFFTFELHPATADTLVLRIGVPDSATYIAVLDAVEASTGLASLGTT